MQARKLLHFVSGNLDRHLKHWLQRRINRWKRERQFAYVLEHHPVSDSAICPICSCEDCRVVTYYFERHCINKNFCSNCFHLFSFLGIPRNDEKAKDLFDYGRPSLWIDVEARLIQQLVRSSGKREGRFLDFGIGGNLPALERVRDMLDRKYEIWGCDLVARKKLPRYFVTYSDDSMLGSFDGICSSEVLEHLENTMEAWRYLNRLLRPIKQGGGIMLHCFPSNVTLNLHHTMVVIGSHTCVFSEKSLQLLCDKTGFRLERISHHHFIPEFLFVKTRDV